MYSLCIYFKQDNMVIGIGSGSTIIPAVEKIGMYLQDKQQLSYINAYIYIKK